MPPKGPTSVKDAKEQVKVINIGNQGNDKDVSADILSDNATQHVTSIGPMCIRELVNIAKDIYNASKSSFQTAPGTSTNANNQPLNPHNHITKLLEHNGFTDHSKPARDFWVTLADGIDDGFLDVHTSAHGQWSSKTKAMALQSLHNILQETKVHEDFSDNMELYQDLIETSVSKSKDLFTTYHKEYKDNKSKQQTQTDGQNDKSETDETNNAAAHKEYVKHLEIQTQLQGEKIAELIEQASVYKAVAYERSDQIKYLQQTIDKMLTLLARGSAPV
jgi:hypothetical protein